MVNNDAVNGAAHRCLGSNGAVHLVEGNLFGALATDAPFAFEALVAGSIPYHTIVYIVIVIIVTGMVRTRCKGHGFERVERLVICPHIAADEKQKHGEHGK